MNRNAVIQNTINDFMTNLKDFHFTRGSAAYKLKWRSTDNMWLAHYAMQDKNQKEAIARIRKAQKLLVEAYQAELF